VGCNGGGIEDNKTCDVIDLLHGHRAIGLKWIFKAKKDEHGCLVKYKACLITKGYVQKPGIDYEEAFALVARMESVKLILAMTVHEGWRIHHMDVKLAFLNGSLEEVVYVQQSPGFSVGEQSQVLRLKKALYGLRQTPRAWYSKLHVSLTSLDFVRSDHKHAVYTRCTVSKPLMICVYVDDLLIAGTLDSDIEVFKQEMRDWFKMRDLELLSYYLGIEVR
jgi:hypothetical protein